MARRGILAALLAAFALSAPAGGATLPPGFTETLVTGGLTSPTAMAIAPDGRIFVAQQGGALRVVKNGSLLPAAFVTLTVNSPPGTERGLLGVAIDPDFATATDKYVYVYYTVPGNPPHNRVSRFAAAGDVATGLEMPILDLEDLGATNHNGGAIHFGPDGKLYVAVGENAIPSNSQSLGNRLGKMLRINSDGTIPSDNPYFLDPMVTGNNKAIWAIGLRNPFTFAFQPGTGRLFINDVGQDTWEEINDGIAKSNYGWNIHEGVANDFPPYRDPLFAYAHMGVPESTGCAIVGAAFYNPAVAQFPADYAGDYFFGDLCSGWVRRFDPVLNQTYDFALGISQVVDLLVSDDGSLYYLARGGGGVLYRVTATPTLAQVWAFTAERRGHDVFLRWRPGGDPRVLGFHAYRGSKRLNHALIRASSRCCTLVDRAIRGAPAYRLEAVLVDGSRRAAGTATPRRT